MSFGVNGTLNASTRELYTLVLSVYFVRLSQLYAYSYCTYKIQPKENQLNSIVVRAVPTALTEENFFQCNGLWGQNQLEKIIYYIQYTYYKYTLFLIKSFKICRPFFLRDTTFLIFCHWSNFLKKLLDEFSWKRAKLLEISSTMAERVENIKNDLLNNFKMV